MNRIDDPAAAKVPSSGYRHLLPREEAREKAINPSIARSDYRLLPFAPSQMGEGARRADEGSWPRVTIFENASPCPC